eukprot:350255-Chlamydomonas_euryale.AAC.3
MLTKQVECLAQRKLPRLNKRAELFKRHLLALLTANRRRRCALRHPQQRVDKLSGIRGRQAVIACKALQVVHADRLLALSDGVERAADAVAAAAGTGDGAGAAGSAAARSSSTVPPHSNRRVAPHDKQLGR